MNRPKCKRCGGPLDIFWDPETNRKEWSCSNLLNDPKNPIPVYLDKEFWEMWNNLSGDDVVRLTKEKPEMEVD